MRHLAVLTCFVLAVVIRCSKTLEANGQLSQVNFAKKAANGNKVRCIGLSCSDGTALVTAIRDDDLLPSDPARLDGESRRQIGQDTRILLNPTQHLFKIDSSLSAALTGIPSDCRHILRIMRKEALDYRSNFGQTIPVGVLADKTSAYLHDLTLSGDTRPLAVTVLLGARCEQQMGSNLEGQRGREGGGRSRRVAAAGGNMVKITCDGSFEYYFCCSAESAYSDEEASLTSKLENTQWSALSVEEAVASLRAMLRTVEASSEEESVVTEAEQAADEGGKGGIRAEVKMVTRPYTIVEIVKVV